jgi:hypothetical protein
MPAACTSSSSSANPGLNKAATAQRVEIDGRATLGKSAEPCRSEKKEPESLHPAVEVTVENEVMEEKWASLQANLAQHQERIQNHCDEVHELVMQRSGVDPRFQQLQRLQIPPIKPHSVSSNSAAVLEHISNTFERITILEAYIRAHGDLITNLPVSSDFKIPLKVEGGID